MSDITKAYWRHGAILEMSGLDAGTLVARGIATSYPAYNTENGLQCVHVLGEKIDRFVPGESPQLFLVGGIKIIRDDSLGDSIESIKPININGLFDEEEV